MSSDRLRAAARRSVTIAVKSLNDAVDNHGTRNEVQSLVDALDDKWKRLNEMDESVLASADDDNFDQEYDKVEQHRESVIKTISMANSYLSANQPSQTPSVAAVTTPVSLPKLVLPEFSGAYLDWRPFWSQFSAAVDQTTLPDAQKFVHLRSFFYFTLYNN